MASFLQKIGLDYVLIEREKNWTKHGYSLGMWSNGRAILYKLGLGENFDRSIVPNRQLVIKNFSGRTLKTYDLSNFYTQYGLGYSHLHRKDLHDWLLSGVDQSKINMETTVTNLKSTRSGIEATLNNGNQQTFDLVVGADGVHSSIRKMYFSENIEKYINWRCWFVIPKTRISETHTVTEYLSPGKFLNTFDDGNSSLALFSCAVDHLQHDDTAGRIERLQEIFRDSPLTKEILKGLKDEDILPTDLEEVKLNSWVKDNVVLLGDAAHAFEPFAGLGGSMALEDAYVLSYELAQIRDISKIPQALQSYETKRRKRVYNAQRVTRKMKTWATLKSPLLFWLMNLFAPLVPTRYFSQDFIRLMNEEL